MTAVFAIAGIAIVVAVGLLAVGRLGELPPPPLDRAPLDLPSGDLATTDVDNVRFAVGLRGYRMDEVDDVLDRVADDLATRDDRIRQLEGALVTAGVPVPAVMVPDTTADAVVGAELPSSEDLSEGPAEGDTHGAP